MVTTDRLFGISTSLAVKAPCKVASNGALTLFGEQTVNDVAVVSGNRVLVKDQDNAADNGIYVVSTGAWKRAADFDGNRDVGEGTLIVVPRSEGRDYFYQVDTPDPIVIGLSELTFTLANDPNVRFDITAAEIAASVTIANEHYAPGDPRRVREVVGGVAVTINVPSDVPTLQDAINLFPTKVPGNVRTEINIESGFAPTSGISVANGDWGHIRIVSEDATVTVHSSFTGAFIFAQRCRSPQLGCLVDMDHKGAEGVYVLESAIMHILPGCGCINAATIGCRVRRVSTVSAHGSRWSGAAGDGCIVMNERCIGNFRECIADNATSRGIWANDSAANIRDASFQNSGFKAVNCDPGGTVTGNANVSGSVIGFESQNGRLRIDGSIADNCTQYALVVKQQGRACAQDMSGVGAGINGCLITEASQVDVSGSDFSGATVDGIEAAGASVVHAYQADVSGAGRYGLFASGATTCNAREIDASDAGDQGIRADSGAAINARLATATGADGNSGMHARNGGIINAGESSASSAGSGYVVVNGGTITAHAATGTLSQTKNTLTANGIIYQEA